MINRILEAFPAASASRDHEKCVYFREHMSALGTADTLEILPEVLVDALENPPVERIGLNGLDTLIYYLDVGAYEEDFLVEDASELNALNALDAHQSHAVALWLLHISTLPIYELYLQDIRRAYDYWQCRGERGKS